MLRNGDLESRILIRREYIIVTAGEETTLDTIVPEPFGNGDTTVVYSDFESGRGQHINYEGWWSYVDSLQDGASTINSDFAFQPGAEGSQYCAWSSFTFGDSQPAYVGIGAQLGYRMDPLHYAYDFSRLRSISFRVKGTANSLTLHFITRLEKDSANMDKNTLFTLDTVPVGWTMYTIDITDAVAALSPAEQERWSRTNRFITWIILTYTRGGGSQSGEIFVDDIVFEFN
jgi:hypothetical protein